MMRDMEKEMHRQKLQREQKIQQDQQQQQKIKKKQDENIYSQTLALQAKERQNKMKQEKESDIHFSKAESVKLNNEEMQRKGFFDNLKRIQDLNDQKHKSLLKYMSQDASVLNSRKDEQAYIKSIQVGEK